MFGERERNLKVVEEKATTLLDEGCQFEGKLTFEGSVQINGRFRGEIFSDGTLIIGEGADVEGTVEIETVVIAGRFSGTIRAKRLIEMQPPAWVRAEIKTSSLVVQEGAVFEGNCSMGKKSEPAVTPLEEPEEKEEQVTVFDFSTSH